MSIPEFKPWLTQSILNVIIGMPRKLGNCADKRKEEGLNEFKAFILDNYKYIVGYRERLRNEGFDVLAECRALGAVTPPTHIKFAICLLHIPRISPLSLGFAGTNPSLTTYRITS